MGWRKGRPAGAGSCQQLYPQIWGKQKIHEKLCSSRDITWHHTLILSATNPLICSYSNVSTFWFPSKLSKSILELLELLWTNLKRQEPSTLLSRKVPHWSGFPVWVDFACKEGIMLCRNSRQISVGVERLNHRCSSCSRVGQWPQTHMSEITLSLAISANSNNNNSTGKSLRKTPPS